MSKKCSTCRKEKEEISFSEGFKTCDICLQKYRPFKRAWEERNKARRKELLEKHRERYRRNAIKYRKEHPEWGRQVVRNRRAKEMQAEGKLTDKEWIDLCNKYNNRCLCCGEKKKLTQDHVIPLSKGGTNWISNIQPLCHVCNARKNNKTIDYRLDYL